MDIILIIAALLLFVFVLAPAVGSVLYLLVAAVIWGLVGYFAGLLLRGRGFGVLGNIALGWAGGIVGSMTLPLLGMGAIRALPFGGILMGVIGALIVVLLVRLIFKSDFGK